MSAESHKPGLTGWHPQAVLAGGCFVSGHSHNIQVLPKSLWTHTLSKIYLNYLPPLTNLETLHKKYSFLIYLGLCRYNPGSSSWMILGKLPHLCLNRTHFTEFLRIKWQRTESMWASTWHSVSTWYILGICSNSTSYCMWQTDPWNLEASIKKNM